MRVYDSVATCNNIFMLARANGWNDSCLAKILDLTPQAISKWRNGGSPSIDTLVTLTDLFDVTLDSLLECREIDMDFHMEVER